MSKARKAFALRIDPVLYEEIERWAQQEFRSVNGQIEFVLRQAVSKRLGRQAAEPSAEESTEPPRVDSHESPVKRRKRPS